MPEALTEPEPLPDAGVDHADVMEFLGLKRAKGLGKSSTKDSGDSKAAP
jgi:hypothetical protein